MEVLRKMSAWFDRIKRFYDTIGSDGERLWGIERVKRAVETNTITEDEYKQITGKDYAE